MKMPFIRRLFGSLCLCGTAIGVAAQDVPAPPIGAASSVSGVALRHLPAIAVKSPESTALLSAAHAGTRLVAVGARGVVVLSDDGGKTWRQAAVVPVRSTLTAVTFIDSERGWAVGHNGVVLATDDAGEHWRVQRFVADVDRPLFSVRFLDRQRGVAVGLWSLVLATSDGGASWREVKVAAPPEGGKTDRNLFSLFADKAGTLYVAAERGTVLRSQDAGQTWQYLETGYKGSLWVGMALEEGGLLVAGMRGSLYRSDDRGNTWRAIDSGSKSSLTGIATEGSKVTVVGLDGVVATSDDGGRTFRATQRPDRLALTAVLSAADGRVITFSKQGIVAP
jgi:photosystem II stability/assembly factor-like uncharacterized protein